MAYINPELDKQVYSDYLVAMLVGTPLKDVARKNKVSERQVNCVKKRMEGLVPKTITPSNKPKMWKYKFKYVQDWIDSLRHDEYEIQDALIYAMYDLHGFSIEEIVKYTGKNEAYVRGCLSLVIHR
jgi:hypothetical protein